MSRGWKRPKDLQIPSETFISNKGYAILKENNEELVEYLKKVLTVTPVINPNGMNSAAANSFPVYRENSKKIYIPRAFGMDWFGPPKTVTISDGEYRPNLEFNGSVRKEQEEPLKNFIDAANDPAKRGGIISVGCGGGKTVMGLYLSTYFKRKTLIVCHKEFLINQWKERIEQFIPKAKVGLLKAKVVDIEDKDIVIASLQSLSMKDYDSSVFEGFGFVMFDECHHLSAEVFSQALPKVSGAKIMLGLSATLNRKDGLRKVFEWFMGRTVYEAKKRDDTSMIIEMVPFYDPHPDYGRERVFYNGKLNIPQMITAICSYKPRNELIINYIKDILSKEPERQILILSDRRNHLKILEEMIKKDKIGTVGYYVGGMKEEDLKESESKKIILATNSMASEGMDIPSLNTLILASPISSIEQPIGRIQRQKQHERKFIPLTIDIWDEFSIFDRQAKKRLLFYRKSGYNIKNNKTDDDTDESDENDKKTKYQFIDEE